MCAITPLKTCLDAKNCPPFAAAVVHDGKIYGTLCYADSLSEIYFKVQGWRSDFPENQIIMVEMKNGHWVPV